jgi:predicted metal-dependent hydrolase
MNSMVVQPSGDDRSHAPGPIQDPRVIEGVRLFNEREYFACHDVFEEIWSEIIDDRRELYQGSIHTAVALFHFSEGNLGGARKMYGSAVGYLTPFRERFTGFDLGRLLDDFMSCFAELLAAREYPARLAIPVDRIPLIHLTHQDEQP